MSMNRTSKYQLAVVAAVLTIASISLALRPKLNEATLASSSDHVVYLKWMKASEAAEFVRESLHEGGREVVIRSDDRLNAVIVAADQATNQLVAARILELDQSTSGQQH